MLWFLIFLKPGLFFERGNMFNKAASSTGPWGQGRQEEEDMGMLGLDKNKPLIGEKLRK
jgi:hypothetical protein